MQTGNLNHTKHIASVCSVSVALLANLCLSVFSRREKRVLQGFWEWSGTTPSNTRHRLANV
jgi:hypothetical protein